MSVMQSTIQLGEGEQVGYDTRTWILDNYHPKIKKFGFLYRAIVKGDVPMPRRGVVPFGPGIPLNVIVNSTQNVQEAIAAAEAAGPIKTDEELFAELKANAKVDRWIPLLPNSVVFFGGLAGVFVLLWLVLRK